jgi:acetyltransferase-like isoleucine patch superfamily enzyme
MNNTSIHFLNVALASDINIEDYVIIGKPPTDISDGELPTSIGARSLIRSHSVIYSGVMIGNTFQSGHHVTIREHTKIGNNVSIGTGCVIEHHVVLHNNVRLHSNVFIPEYCILHDNCWVGPNVVFTNSRYPASINSKDSLIGVTVMESARIGANVTILPGLTIGNDSLIGAGSVVVKDVAEGDVVAGNPAKKIGCIKDLPY